MRKVEGLPLVTKRVLEATLRHDKQPDHTRKRDRLP